MENFTADQLLGIKDPTVLFTPEEIKSEYRTLVKVWHPDALNGKTRKTEVFGHITALYHQGLKMVETDSWVSANTIAFKLLDGKTVKIRFKKAIPFELGDMYIGSTIVAYFIKKEFKKLAENALQTLKNIKYADDKMKEQFSTFLPHILKTADTEDGTLVVMKKKEEELLLRDVFESLDKKLDPKHVAWITSSLYNLVCFFQYKCNGIVHNSISMDTYFISPPGHYGVLLGGWWYAAKADQPLVALPKRTIDNTKSIRDGGKTAKKTTDLELIKVTGRELLNDPIGNRILGDKSIPSALSLWLSFTTSSDSAPKEYADWNEVLTKSWGKRKYVKLDVTEQTLYG